MMIVSLFTFRELLRLLGVEDYGTYNVVGGVVILFSFLSNAMTQSNQRFLSYHVGKGDKVLLKRTFTMIVNVQLILAGLILVLAETIGLWFINCKMNFTGTSMVSVNIVYQFSIITFLFQIFQIPYTSSIIAHERMSFFSYASIGEALLKLGVVLLLGIFRSGRLVIYAGLLTISAFSILLIYFFFTNKYFPECRYSRLWDKDLFKQLIGFSSWNLIGGLGVVGTSQGLNILFNIFCGVVANASVGIAHQVTSAVSSLVGNMQMAFNPQIIKSYATNDIAYYKSLIFRAARFSFYLIALAGLPVIICAQPILSLWLDEVPDLAVSFVQLSILYCMIDALSGSLWVGVQAIGKIKWYTLAMTLCIVLNLPIGYVLLKLNFSPNSVLLTRAILCFIVHLVRIGFLKYLIQFPVWAFLKDVTLRAFLTAIICIPLPLCLNNTITSDYNYLIIIPFTLIEVGFVGFYLLLSSNERTFIKTKVRGIILKNK